MTSTYTHHREWVHTQNPRMFVLFVHGFAVKWHSKRLFTDIMESPHAHGAAAVMLDLYDYDEKGNCHLLGYDAQKERIVSLLEEIKQSYSGVPLVIIGHSMGSGVAAALLSEGLVSAKKVVLLAPAKGAAGPSIGRKMLNRDGSYEDQAGCINFVRKDGTMSKLSTNFCKSFEFDFMKNYKQVLPHQDHRIILADQDQYSSADKAMFNSFSTVVMSHADHNFSDIYRADVVDQVWKYLNAEPAGSEK